MACSLNSHTNFVSQGKLKMLSHIEEKHKEKVRQRETYFIIVSGQYDE
jgi:hypothetical protein